MGSEIMTLNPEQSYQLSKNQTLSLCAGEVNISCVSGIAWVTWAGGHEKCLAQGESLVVQSRIKICIQAFTDSHIRLLRTQTPGIRHRMLSGFTLDRLRQMDIGYGKTIPLNGPVSVFPGSK